MKILLADDAGGALVAAPRLLTSWGYAVEVVGDGLAALRRARVWRPDLVIAAVALPRMDGFTLAAALASGAETHRVRVAIAASTVDARERSTALRLFAHLAMPLEMGQLWRLVSRLQPGGQASRRRRRGTRR